MTNARPSVLIVGPGRVGCCVGSFLLEGFIEQRIEFERLYYLGRTNPSARAAVLDQTHDLILRASLERDPARRERLFDGIQKVVAVDQLGALADVRVVILAYGATKSGISEQRRSLFDEHARILDAVAIQLRGRISPDAVWISTVNPVEQICEHLSSAVGISRARVIGIGATHDTARLLEVLSTETGVALAEIMTWNALVVGPHDERMIPCFGAPCEHLSPTQREKVAATVRDRGLEILRARGYPPTLAPARATAIIAEAVLSDTPLQITASVYSESFSSFLGIPALIRSEGVVETYEEGLEAECRDALASIVANG